MQQAMDVVVLKAVTPAANTDFAGFTAPYAGTATFAYFLSTASVVNLHATTVGATATATEATNSGNSVAASQWQTLDVPISSGAAYALQVATAQASAILVSCKVVPQ